MKKIAFMAMMLLSISSVRAAVASDMKMSHGPVIATGNGQNERRITPQSDAFEQKNLFADPGNPQSDVMRDDLYMGPPHVNLGGTVGIPASDMMPNIPSAAMQAGGNAPIATMPSIPGAPQDAQPGMDQKQMAAPFGIANFYQLPDNIRRLLHTAELLYKDQMACGKTSSARPLIGGNPKTWTPRKKYGSDSSTWRPMKPVPVGIR